MTRAKKQDHIKEDIKHVIEELCGLTPECIPYEIFSREPRLGAHDVLVMSKEDLCDLS